MAKLEQPTVKVRDYVAEFFDGADEDGMKRFYLLFGPQGYAISLTKVDERVLLVAQRHVETKRA